MLTWQLPATNLAYPTESGWHVKKRPKVCQVNVWTFPTQFFLVTSDVFMSDQKRLEMCVLFIEKSKTTEKHIWCRSEGLISKLSYPVLYVSFSLWRTWSGFCNRIKRSKGLRWIVQGSLGPCPLDDWYPVTMILEPIQKTRVFGLLDVNLDRLRLRMALFLTFLNTTKTAPRRTKDVRTVLCWNFAGTPQQCYCMWYRNKHEQAVIIINQSTGTHPQLQ